MIARSVYLKKRFFGVIGGLTVLFLLSYFFEWLFLPAQLLFAVFVVVIIGEAALLFQSGAPLRARRSVPERLSNGDDNRIRIYIENRYPFPVSLMVIDEIPHQFQRRDVLFDARISPNETRIIEYDLRPAKRGKYSFGSTNIYASGIAGLLLRRFTVEGSKEVPVYPSFLQMRKFELMAFSDRLMDPGIKKIRRIGHNLEFEQIKEYVPGDDFRTINWKATARHRELMVNLYQDEKSQPVYSLIDKGRTMQMPFEKMSLLDYAINASLVISNIAIKKEDQAGLITFQHSVNKILPAARRNIQMKLILEALYHEKTAYRESDFSALSAAVGRHLRRRSLLLLFTNFETLSGMERQLPYLRQMASRHVLVTIFFQNTEMNEMLESRAFKTREIYEKAIAEKLAFEKRLIVKELRKHGIHVILTSPASLTVNTINKYLELKSRGLI